MFNSEQSLSKQPIQGPLQQASEAGLAALLLQTRKLRVRAVRTLVLLEWVTWDFHFIAVDYLVPGEEMSVIPSLIVS